MCGAHKKRTDLLLSLAPYLSLIQPQCYLVCGQRSSIVTLIYRPVDREMQLLWSTGFLIVPLWFFSPIDQR